MRRGGTLMSSASRLLAQAHRFQKILVQDFTWSDVGQQLAVHIGLMVIHNLNFVRARFPAETNPPLIIDPDTVLARPIALQRLQPGFRVARVLSLN